MMKSPLRLFTVLLVFAGAAACTAAEVTVEEEQPDLRALQAEVLAAEDAMNLAVDALDCDTGMANMIDADPLFVSNGQVIRTKAELREMCGGMVAQRTGAVFAIDNRTATMLGTDGAVVVRDGMYTINFRDQPTAEIYLVMTSVWQREADGWKMVHLHESVPQPPPAGE